VALSGPLVPRIRRSAIAGVFRNGMNAAIAAASTRRGRSSRRQPWGRWSPLRARGGPRHRPVGFALGIDPLSSELGVVASAPDHVISYLYIGVSKSWATG
jgi:hypothetical protein